MMDTIFSLFVNAMLWGTVPLTLAVGYWERRLAISNSGHELAEVFLVALMFAWVYFWYCIGEYQSITHYLPESDEPQPVQTGRLPALYEGHRSQTSRAESVAVILKKEVTRER